MKMIIDTTDKTVRSSLLTDNNVSILPAGPLKVTYCAADAGADARRLGSMGGPGEWIGSSLAHGIRHGCRRS